MWPFRREQPPRETKANPIGASLVLSGGNDWKRATNRKSYIDEGYQGNPIVYRAIREIASAAASIRVLLRNGETEIETHPALDLIANPNPRQAWEQWLTEQVTNRMIFGESWAVAAGEGQPGEIWSLSPLEMSVKPGESGMPSAYMHERNGRKVLFPVDQLTGASDVFFLRLHNPGDYWRGQSPLMSAALACDVHNAGMRWNWSLLKKGARPSGIVRFTDGDPGPDGLSRLREWFKTALTGADNAGEVAILTGGAEWVPMDRTPQEMDFLNMLKEAKQLIAMSLGVPLPLVDNDASTFNNLAEAKERLYTDTVIPMMEDFVGALGAWLLPRYGDGLEFALDLDTLPALENLRQKNYDRAVVAYNSGLLSLEESRELMGFEPIPAGTIKPTPAAPTAQTEQRSLLARLAYG